MTSHGYVKAVIVFVDFPDDNWEPNNPDWPVGQAPVWVGTPKLFTPVNQFTATGINTIQGSVSDYFWAMSQKNNATGLRLYGDCYHITFPLTRQEVADQGITADQATGQVIMQLDATVDFAQYNRWRTTTYFNHTFDQDNVVDLFIFCWRNISRDLKDYPDNTPQWMLARTLSSLSYDQPPRPQLSGIGANPLPPFVLVDNGQRSIYTRFGPDVYGNNPHIPYGAGIWFTDWLQGGGLASTQRSTGVYDGKFRIMIHELGHILNGYHRQSGVWSILSVSDSRSYATSAKEMIDLGWITPTVVLKTGSVPSPVSLGDLYTTGQCLAVEVDLLQGNLWEEGSKWYLIENHQMISPYDFAIGRLDWGNSAEETNRAATNGLYMYYCEDNLVGYPRQHIQSASGEFEWDNDRTHTIFGDVQAPTFERLGRVRSAGATHSEQVHLTTPRLLGRTPYLSMTTFPIYSIWKNNQQSVFHHYLNQGLDDHHDLCRAPVWSPWSSPSSSYNRSGALPTSSQPTIQTGISVVVNSVTNGVFNLSLANQYQPIGPPSEPINVTHPSSVAICATTANPITYSATLGWSANIEPDLAGYRVYRRPGLASTGWEQVAQLSTGTLQYTDTETTNPFPDIPFGYYLGSVRYRIVAYDTDGNESSFCGKVYNLTLDYVACDPGVPEYVLQGVDDVLLEPSGGYSWPSPAGAWVHFEPKLQGTITGDAEIVIMDVTGAVVHRESFVWKHDRSRISVPMQDKMRGVYALSLRIGSKYFSHVIIKD